MLDEHDLSRPQLVRNLFAVANRRDSDRKNRFMPMATMVSEEFEARRSAYPFFGYVIPYDGTNPDEPKDYHFTARWTLEAAQDAKAKTGIDYEKEITRALVEEFMAEIEILAGDQIIFPCLVDMSSVMIDAATFEPVARFHMLYYSGPSRMVPPIDMANAPPVIV